MISLKNVQKVYNDFIAINIKELYVPDGCIFGFLGKNGAGKTTTIKNIIGMLRPTSGEILVDKYNMNTEFSKAKKIIGYVADKPTVYESLTGHEFVRFMANLYGIKNSNELENDINNWFIKLEIKEKGEEIIKNYSHGTKQKIALIGALIHKPKLLILDEPTVGLDPQSTKQLKDIIKEFRNNGGTVFLSTHILQIAEEICDYFAIINKGEILYSGELNNIADNFGSSKSLEDIFIMITNN